MYALEACFSIITDRDQGRDPCTKQQLNFFNPFRI